MTTIPIKKLTIIILVVATLLNIGAGAYIFLDIQTLEVPETLLKIDLVNLTAEEAVLQISLGVTNPNAFAMSLQNIKVVMTTDTGDTLNTFFIKGGEIPAQKNTTFIDSESLRFNKTLPKGLISKITGTIGITFFGIVKKTLPLKFSMITSLDTLVNQLTVPSIHLDGNFSDVTQEGVNYTGIVEISNPYTFTLAVQDIVLTMTTDSGIQVGSIAIQGKTILPHTTQQLLGSGKILLQSLDAHTLHMDLKGGLVIYVAGIEKSFNLSFGSDILVPRIDKLLSNLPTDTTMSTTYKFTLKGFLEDIAFEIVNPNKISLLAKDITLHLNRIDKNTSYSIANGTLENGIITPQTTTVLHGNILIPYRRLFMPVHGRFIPDRLQVIMRANVTIPGLNQTLWVGMIAYQDFRWIKK